MKQFINGTSAVNISCAAASWQLCRLDGGEQLTTYELRTKGAADEGAAEVVREVINALLAEKRVGIIAESDESAALSSLSSVWSDGRMMRHSGGSAFVALDTAFCGIPSAGLATCAKAGTAFRFMGFTSRVPADILFRTLVDGDSDAAIQLSCPDIAGGALSLRVNSESIDESVVLRQITEAVGGCGRSLSIDL